MRINRQVTKYTSSSTTGAQIFLSVAMVISIVAIYTMGFNLHSLLLVVLGYFLYGCLGIVVTYHRLLTHNSYQSRPWLTKILSTLGCFSSTGSPLAWANIHVNHHLYSDKTKDPHSPLNDGLRIFALDYKIEDKTSYLKHIVKDKYQQFLHRYYFIVLVSYSIILYSVGGLYLMVFFHLIPAIVTALMSNVVNYVGHKPTWFGGYRTYELRDQSTNNWVWSVFSWGESWHNNHHRYPKRYTFSDKWYEIDISGLIIKLIKVN